MLSNHKKCLIFQALVNLGQDFFAILNKISRFLSDLPSNC